MLPVPSFIFCFLFLSKVEAAATEPAAENQDPISGVISNFIDYWNEAYASHQPEGSFNWGSVPQLKVAPLLGLIFLLSEFTGSALDSLYPQSNTGSRRG